MTLLERLNAYEKLIRLDKPIGSLLLLWPTLWALWLSSRGRPDWQTVWIFILGTVLMRSAGCAINDYVDRGFDPHVARTRERPLALGLIRPAEALIVAAVLALAAVVIAATYPFTKRFFVLPQAYLGIAFGFGIPMAFAAHTGQVSVVGWVLLLANVFWAIAYDTEYAMVDREDDRKIGIRTSAITFGRFDVAAVMACHAMFFLVLAWIGWRVALGIYFHTGLLIAAAMAATQYRMIKDRDPASCFRAFLHNNWVGGMIFAGLAASLHFPKPF